MTKGTQAPFCHLLFVHCYFSAPISPYRYADAITPLWKLPRSSFSSGAWAFSSGRPTPNSTHGSPSSSWKVDTTGIDPPSRLNTGRWPNPCSMARPAACTNGLSNAVIHGLPPCMRVVLSSTVFGVTFCKYSSNRSPIFLGSWFGTSRMLTLAIATAGSTVLAPSPVNPDSRRSEEHTSELQSQSNLVCRLLL